MTLATGIAIVAAAAALVWALVWVADVYLRQRYRDPYEREE